MTFSVTPVPIEVGTSKVADSVYPLCKSPILKVIVSIVSAFAKRAPAMRKTAQSNIFIRFLVLKICLLGRELTLAHVVFPCQNETPVLHSWESLWWSFGKPAKTARELPEMSCQLNRSMQHHLI